MAQQKRTQLTLSLKKQKQLTRIADNTQKKLTEEFNKAKALNDRKGQLVSDLQKANAAAKTELAKRQAALDGEAAALKSADAEKKRALQAVSDAQYAKNDAEKYATDLKKTKSDLEAALANLKQATEAKLAEVENCYVCGAGRAGGAACRNAGQ